jgi:hypothetical protein
MIRTALVMALAVGANAQCGPTQLTRVQTACCPPGTTCSNDLPPTCSGTCSSTFLHFWSQCQSLINSAGPTIEHQFQNFHQMCIAQRGSCTTPADCGAHTRCAPVTHCTTPGNCNRCICARGYSGDGRTCTPTTPTNTHTPPANLLHGSVAPIATTGTPVEGTITRGGTPRARQAVLYSFNAVAGTTYVITAHLETLADSVISLWGTDRTTWVAENDNAAGQGRGSRIRWTCPATGAGLHYIAVMGHSTSQRGTFTLSVTGAAATGTSGACSANGVTLDNRAGNVDFTDGYTNGATCQWHINCPSLGQGRQSIANIRFTHFNTEANYDFVTVWDGRTNGPPSLALTSGQGLSGDSATVPGFVNNYHSHTSHMTVSLHTDASVTHDGFSFRYTCSTGTPVGPPPPPVDRPITPGVPVRGNIARAGEIDYYQIMLTSGTAYTISTTLAPPAPPTPPGTPPPPPGPHPLHDSVLIVYDDAAPHHHQVAFNDDAPSAGSGSTLASEVIFTPNATQLYYIGVRGYSRSQTGTYSVNIDAGQAGGACTPTGLALTGHGTVSYGENQYQNRANCRWTLTCPAGRVGSIFVRSLETEANFDFLNVYDGATTTGTRLAHLSGVLDNTTTHRYAATGTTALVNFVTDGSVTRGHGFQFYYYCAQARNPPGTGPSTSTCTNLRIGTAHPTRGTVSTAHPKFYYCFNAVGGRTYSIRTNLGTLHDSVMSIYSSTPPPTATTTPIAHNDDAPGAGLASQIQFTPPTTGTYFVEIKAYNGATDTGDFTTIVTVDDSSHSPCQARPPPPVPGAPPSPPPPHTANTLTGNQGTVTFDSTTCGNSCNCNWELTCQTHGQHPQVTFRNFQTEANYDFVKLRRGVGFRGPSIANFSGAMLPAGSTHADRQGPVTGATYSSPWSGMTIQFTTDASVFTANHFTFHYQCRFTGSPPGPPPPATNTLAPNGRPISGSVATAGQRVRYNMAVRGGVTYAIEVTLNTLSDSVLSVYTQAGNAPLVSNDDYGNSLASYVEWTAPRTGTYVVEVRGYSASQVGSFTLSASVYRPCHGNGANLDGDSGVVSYMPDGNYQDHLNCWWHISCSDSNDVAHVTLTALSTERSFDYVSLYEGNVHSTSGDTATRIARVSGALSDLTDRTYEAIGQTMSVGFTTDGSVNSHGGFRATYNCGPSSHAAHGCTDRINVLDGPTACHDLIHPTAGGTAHSCAADFCETCPMDHYCDRTCRICH